jgi:hypothetical protein
MLGLSISWIDALFLGLTEKAKYHQQVTTVLKTLHHLLCSPKFQNRLPFLPVFNLQSDFLGPFSHTFIVLKFVARICLAVSLPIFNSPADIIMPNTDHFSEKSSTFPHFHQFSLFSSF